MKTILNILTLIFNILKMFKKKPKTKDDLRLDEDRRLAEAIKKGDAQTISAIRERRRHYPNALILLLTCTIILGCVSYKKAIPLATGTLPYQIPAGEYIDTQGLKHVEIDKRWSLSEQDLFNNSTKLQPITNIPKPKETSNKIQNILININLLLLLIVFCVIILKKVYRRDK